MKGSKLSPLEKAIARKIEKTKSKASQPGFLKRLVAKLNPKIEDALSRGCEYDDLAKSISETGVKISAATLKQYHNEYRRSLTKELTSTTEEKAVKEKDNLQLDEEKEQASRLNETTGQGDRQLNRPDTKQSAINKLFANK